LEAGIGNIPVFCSDLPVLRELGGEDISYFDPHGDPAEIARQIVLRLNEDSSSRWTRYVKHHFTWQSINELYIEPLLMAEN
jgi:glycosyltransferase involved in cell wall biosynthesis